MSAPQSSPAEVLSSLHLPGLPQALPSSVIDSHTHLDATAAYSGLQPDESLALAAAVGVDRLVQVGCDLTSSRWAVQFAAQHSQVVAAVALHPNDAARLTEAELDAQLAQLAQLASAGEQVRAVGETGLDYFRTTDPDARARQRRSFAAHIQIAQNTGRTLVIHDRDAHDDVLTVLDEQGWPDRVVMHCFSGDAQHARRCLETGAQVYLSFPGTVTFKANQDLRDACLVVPADRILVETDAPYLTPVPARGKPNAPYLLPHTVRFIGELRGATAAGTSGSLAGWCDQLSANTEQAFGGPWGIAADEPDQIDG